MFYNITTFILPLAGNDLWYLIGFMTHGEHLCQIFVLLKRIHKYSDLWQRSNMTSAFKKSRNIHHLASSWAAPTSTTIYLPHPYQSIPSISGWDRPDHVQPMFHTVVTEGPMAKSSTLHCLLPLGGRKGGRQIPKALELYAFIDSRFET